MSFDLEDCQGAGYHAPLPIETERHHVFPIGLATLLGVPIISRVVSLCSNCHTRVHHALRHLINSGESAHRLSVAETILVRAAWEWWQMELIAMRHT